MLNGHKDLIVWQKAMDLVMETYNLVKLLPKNETFALSDQMRRSVVSIPSNIVEGSTRNSTKEFINFLSIANGSRAELETQIEICIRLKFITQEQATQALSLTNEIGKMCTTLINKLQAKSSN